MAIQAQKISTQVVLKSELATAFVQTDGKWENVSYILSEWNAIAMKPLAFEEGEIIRNKQPDE